MAEVDDLDERLHLGSLLGLLLAHSTGDLARVSVNTSDYMKRRDKIKDHELEMPQN